MAIWQAFWAAALLVAGGGFAAITIIVILKGSQDMRAMLRGLRARHEEERTH